MVIINLFDKNGKNQDSIDPENLESVRQSIHLNSIQLNKTGAIALRLIILVVTCSLIILWVLWSLIALVSAALTLLSLGKWKVSKEVLLNSWKHLKVKSACLISCIVMLMSPAFGFIILTSYLILRHKELPNTFFTRFVLSLMQQRK
jgi:hypothetical protein